jgi:Pentapeptide repeats (9 copies)
MRFSLFTVNENEFLKPHEAAKLLRVSEEEFFNAVFEGDIPGNRISGRWRFSRTELMRLCKQRNDRLPTPYLREEGGYFFDDEEAYKERVKRVVREYAQGIRSFPWIEAIENADFSGLDLSGIDFWDAGLRGANFSGCILRNAGFMGAGLNFANFEGADLTGADFRSAFVDDAIFKGANLTDADFRVSCLSGVNLTGARIWQTRF